VSPEGSSRPFKVAVLASGAGTNLQALLDKVHRRDGIEIVAVVSDHADARALQRARDAEVPARAFRRAEYGGDRLARDRAIADWLAEREVELVVLAGYMQLLGADFLARFPDAVINVHPALLPAFPGLDAIAQAVAYGVKVFGVTVHFVDDGVDTGPVILQRAFEVPDARAPEDLLPRIHEIEHVLLPEAVRLIARGEVRIDRTDRRRVHVGSLTAIPDV
jgi:phosphoribosylglycinamide formyltransferase-1